jgi:hypothetical protein
VEERGGGAWVLHPPNKIVVGKIINVSCKKDGGNKFESNKYVAR